MLDIVCSLFGDVLDVRSIGPDDDFFDLGGNSLLAGRLAARIRKQTGMRIELDEFLRNPTPRQVAALVSRGQS